MNPPMPIEPKEKPHVPSIRMKTFSDIIENMYGANSDRLVQDPKSGEYRLIISDFHYV